MTVPLIRSGRRQRAGRLAWRPEAVEPVGDGFRAFETWLEPVLRVKRRTRRPGMRASRHLLEWMLMGLSVAIAIAGIALARYFYHHEARDSADAIDARLRPAPHAVLYNKWYVDEAYDFLFVNGLCKGGGTRARRLRPKGGGWRRERRRLAHALHFARLVSGGTPGLWMAPCASLLLREAAPASRSACCKPGRVQSYALFVRGWACWRSSGITLCGNDMDQHLLSIVLFTPLAGLAVLLFMPSAQKNAHHACGRTSRRWPGSWFRCRWSLRFDKNAAGLPVRREARLDSQPRRATIYLGIDGISLLLVMLTTVMGFLAILSSWSAIEDRVKEYYAMFLLLQTGMIGVFMSLDFFLFYVFWELVLVPMYFIIGVWGGPRKLYAAIKFFLYTLAGSVLMLLGILTLYFQHFQQFGFYTFEIAELMKLNMPLGLQQWVFWAFFLGFAIKVPMFPFHTWLPDAHVEAPTAGSVILASVLLKMGTYGFIRFSLPLLPQGFRWTSTIVQILAVLSIIGIIYGALVSLMQKDWKKLVAYSSVSHLGFCTLGIFSLNPNGIAGSVLQQINHGISTGMLFLVDRRDLRAPPHARDHRVRRPGARDAEVRRRLRHRHAELGGPAAAERLRRRVHDSAGRFRGQPRLGGLRRDGRDSRRRLPAVALPAHHARPGDQRQEPAACRT